MFSFRLDILCTTNFHSVYHSVLNCLAKSIIKPTSLKASLKLSKTAHTAHLLLDADCRKNTSTNLDNANVVERFIQN